MGKQPRVVALAATDVEPNEATDIRQDGEERRGV